MTGISLSAALLLLVGELVLVAAVSRGPAGARAGLAISVILLPLATIVEAIPLYVALLAMALLMISLRALDLARSDQPTSFMQRLAHLAVLVDTRKVTRRARSLDVRAAGGAALAGALTLAALVALAEVRASAGPRPLEWAVVGLGVFAWFEFASHLSRFIGGCLGAALPPISDAPQRSTSLAEFWGRRWNPVIAGVLKERCFTPMARRGAARGLLATFALSGVLHFYIGAMALDWPMALSLGGFFLAQPPLLLAERGLGVRRWPPVAGWLWTLAALAVLSPLILEPLRRLMP